MTQGSEKRSVVEVLHVDDGLLDDTDLAISDRGGSNGGGLSDGDGVGVSDDHLLVLLDVLGELVKLSDDLASLTSDNQRLAGSGSELESLGSLAPAVLDSSVDGITEDSVGAFHAGAVVHLVGPLSFSSVSDGTIAFAYTGSSSGVLTSALSPLLLGVFRANDSDGTSVFEFESAGLSKGTCTSGSSSSKSSSTSSLECSEAGLAFWNGTDTVVPVLLASANASTDLRVSISLLADEALSTLGVAVTITLAKAETMFALSDDTDASQGFRRAGSLGSNVGAEGG